MFVVMTVGATEAEVLGVKGQILGEGLTPFDHAGPDRHRDRGRRRARWQEGGPRGAPRGPSRRGARHADLAPVQADLARVPSRGHGHPHPGRGRRRRIAHDDGRPVLRREPRPAVRDGRRGQGGRRHDPAGRRVQATDQPVRLPGPGRRSAALSRRSPRPDRPAGHHRGDGAEPGGHRRRVRGHPPDRHPEHAELLARCATSGASPARSCSSAATAPRSRSG